MTETIADRFQAVRREMNATIIERAELVDGVVLAMLTRENILALGPPGNAKSWSIRLAAQAVQGSTVFEKLLTGHTKPDEVFGPPKLSALKQDRLEHPDKGYLQHADFAFTDEVFKANSAILHGLLGAMNEHTFKDGDTMRRIPLQVLLGASNELPKEEGLEAVYDRFLFRYRLDYIREDSNFAAMLSTPQEPVLQHHVSMDELKQAQADVQGVQVPDAVLQSIIRIRNGLNREGVIASDRRYKQTVKAVRARAWLRGAKIATDDDLLVCLDTLWTTPEQRIKVSQIVTEVANPLQRKADSMMDNVWSAWREVDRFDASDPKQNIARTQQAIEALTKVNAAVDQLGELRDQMAKEGRDTMRIGDQIAKAEQIRDVRISDVLKVKDLAKAMRRQAGKMP